MRHRGLRRVGLRSGELRREGEGRSPAADREAALREAGHDDQRELQALGLVGGEHGDRVRGIERPVVIGVVARPIRQQVEVRHQEREARIGQHGGLVPNEGEQAHDGLHRDVPVGLPCQAGQAAAAPQVVVEDLRGRSPVGHLAGGLDVTDQPLHGRPGGGRDAHDARLGDQLAQHLPERPVPSAGHLEQCREVRSAEVVRLRRGEGVQVQGGGRIGGRAQEGQQLAACRPPEQAAAAGGPRRQPRPVERLEEGQRVAVAAHEDGHLPQRQARGRPGGQGVGDPGRFRLHGREALADDGARPRPPMGRRAAGGARRPRRRGRTGRCRR